MPVEKSYARLGFFIVVSLAVVLVTAVFFIQRLKRRDAIGMVTYTNENVFGLNVSSPVRLRGVPVGQVTDIRVDPRGAMVEIDFELFLDRLNTIGIDIAALRKITDINGVAPNLRAQLMGNPITGEAYLLLDQSQNPPLPIELGFQPNKPYVPSVRSPFGILQDRLPAILDHADTTFQTLTEIVARVPESLDRSDRFFTNSDRFFTNVESMMHESQLPKLSADSRKFFSTTSAQIEQIKSEMDGVIGAEGTLTKFLEEARVDIKNADLPGATQSEREAADNFRLVSDDLRRFLPAIRDSLEQLRELSEMLELQPESIVYGPRPPDGKHR
jgi:paraquat-inducible protein B